MLTQAGGDQLKWIRQTELEPNRSQPMAARLKSILICGFALGLVSVLGAGQPRDISFVAAHDQSNFVMRALASKPVRVSVAINGKTIPPAPGSAAGVWFYADGEKGAQALLTGHAAVPGSWRMTAALNTGREVRVSVVLTERERVSFRPSRCLLRLRCRQRPTRWSSKPSPARGRCASHSSRFRTALQASRPNAGLSRVAR